MSKLSLRGKIIIISAIVIAVLAIVGVIIFKSVNVKTVTTAVAGDTSKKLSEEEIIEEVKEEVVVVPQDNSIDSSLTELVTFGNLEVEVPKAKVAKARDEEDPEKVKKKGGASVSQGDTAAMFENTGVKSYGIDVSSYQGNIDWAAVRASGVDFAIIRAGFRGYGTGALKEDPYFRKNAANASANGIKVGAYFYSAAVNETEALEEAITIVKTISTSRITYPVVYDSEEIGVAGHRTAGVSGAQAASNANTFLNYVRSMGYEPMLYANKSDIGKMGRGNFSCKFWLAHYTNSGQTDYTGSHHMWQYTSEGSVPGINGKVDMNVAYFSYGATANAKHEHNYNILVKNSKVDPKCTEPGSKVMQCSCGETKKEEIPALGHKWGNWTVIESEKVENKIKKSRTCSQCKTVETKEFDCEHDYKLKETLEEATCEKVGKAQYECTLCGHIEEKEIPKKEHEYELQKPYKEDPTCEKDGVGIYKCKKCGETEERTIPALGHELGELIQNEKEKLQYRECKRCKNRFEEAPYEPTTNTEKPSNVLEQQ